MANQTTTTRTRNRSTRVGASARRAARPSFGSRRGSKRVTQTTRRGGRTTPRSNRTNQTRANARGASGTSDRVQVQRLLDRFCDAFTEGDGRAAAECFAYPSLMVMGNGSNLLGDEQTVAEFFDNAPAQYQPKGIYDTRADILKIDRLNDRLLLVHTHWPYFDEQGDATGDGESSVYVIRREPRGKAVICAAIPIGTDRERGIRAPSRSRSRRSIRSTPSRR
jgi:hypothetical protein